MQRRKPKRDIKKPRYMKWRDGKPRWELGGKGGQLLASAGFKSQDLKDSAGNWLSFENACDRARILNQDVDAWRKGETVSPDSPSHKLPSRKGYTIADMIEKHLLSEQMLAKSENTRKAYQFKSKPILYWLGDLAPNEIKNAHALKFQATLLDVYFWKKQAIENKIITSRTNAHPYVLDMSKTQREDLRERRLENVENLDDFREAPGYTMSFDVMIYASIMWKWAGKYLDIEARNVFSGNQLSSPLGRIRFATNAEIEHLVSTADKMTMPEVGDMIILALHTLQRRVDLMSLDWKQFDTGSFNIVQKKTKRLVKPAVTQALKKRGDEMRLRQTIANGASPISGPMLRELGGVHPFSAPDKLTYLFKIVRDEAAKTMPQLHDFQLRDLRDTGVTRVYLATYDILRVCQMSGHSPNSLNTIVKAYLAAHPEISIQAASDYDKWMTNSGAKW